MSDVNLINLNQISADNWSENPNLTGIKWFGLQTLSHSREPFDHLHIMLENNGFVYTETNAQISSLKLNLQSDTQCENATSITRCCEPVNSYSLNVCRLRIKARTQRYRGQVKFC